MPLLFLKKYKHLKFWNKILGFLSKKNEDPFFIYIESITSLQAKNLGLYRLAFQHKSKNKENNERLEFLGDSILDAVISEIIYKHFPRKDEGDLSKLRSKMVSRNMLNIWANKLHLLENLSYRESTPAQGLQNIEGNTLEALIGAVYLDQGFVNCKAFILNKLIEPNVNWRNLENEIVDYKSLLYTHFQKDGKSIGFKLIKENIEMPEERFCMGLELDTKILVDACGKSKKQAEQKVAQIYLEEHNLL